MENGDFIFDFKKADIEIKNLILCVPGRYNVENALAAIIVALSLNLDPNVIREALKVYTGVKRRFEYQIKRPDFVYIDDYAHHPEEIKALITAVKELYPRKKITGIFQPHLFTRTRDCMEGFAESLAMLDCLILLEIYPAREVPINGVNSDILLDMVKSNSKILVTKERALEIIKEEKPEVLLTIGAGDIDQLIMPILNYFNFL